MGRLMFANCPPLGCSHVHTFGGTYSVITVPLLAQPASQLGTGERSFPVSALCLARAYGQEAR